MRSLRHSRGLTLIEVLVVFALVAMLASVLAGAIIQVRRYSLQVTCQENLRQIGIAINQMAMSNAGIYPAFRDSRNIPWWANVYEQWSGDTDGLDMIEGTDGLQLPPDVPLAVKKLFHCPMAGALMAAPTSYQADPAVNLDNSISYGMNFDVKRDDPDKTPYECSTVTTGVYREMLIPPASAADRNADQYTINEVKTPGSFILLSEANTDGPDPQLWTGGRIGPAATEETPLIYPPTSPPVNPLHPARIVGRHGGRANVLYADMHVDTAEAGAGGNWEGDLNLNTPLWTLPDD